MADTKGRLVFDDFRGGRNGYDPPWAIGKNECVEALNIEWYKTRLGRKRAGSLAQGGGNPGWSGASTLIVNLFRYVPGTDSTLAQLWAVTNGEQFANLIGSNNWALAAPVKDACTGNGEDVTGASINAKEFFAYKSAVSRMHLTAGGGEIRRSGLAASAAPTAANGGGAGVATLRYYRERSTRQSGGITLGRSEPSASVSFTPGANGVTVTQAAVINEGETHWEVEGSIDNITFYRIATVVIGTTTYLDNATPTTYNTNPLSASTGFYTLQKPYKFVAADKQRILGFGSFTTTDKQHRIEYSAVIGSSDVSDEERVDTTTNYFGDLDENDSGIPTGLAGPINGSFFAFKEEQTWQGTPTGSVAQPYRWDAISKSIGAVTQVAIDRGEDQDGSPALYWMSKRGPYRWTLKRGLEYIGKNVEDYVTPTGTATFNNAATVLARVLYYPAKRQVYFWWATGSSTNPDVLFVFDITSGGWSRWSGRAASASAAVMFSNTIGATMSKDLKPYFGGVVDFVGSDIAGISKGDTGTTEDNNGPFQAYVTSGAFEPGGPGMYGEVGNITLLADAATGVTLSATTIGDFAAPGKTTASTALLTPDGSETIVSKVFERTALSGDLQFVQYQIGDAAATTAAWNITRFVVPRTSRGPVSG